MPDAAPYSPEGLPRLRRKRWWLLGLALVLAAVAAAGGCSMLEPFEPTVPTGEMAAAGIAGRIVATSEGPIYLVSSTGPPEAAGPAVVFVHGSPGTWEAFQVWLSDPELGRRARLVSVDRPGYGISGRGTAEPSLEKQARRIAAALRADGVERAILVGHSLGGPVIARMAIDFPERVAGLLLVAPSIDPALERHRWYNVAGSLVVVQWFLPVDWVVSNREIWPLKRELQGLATRLGEIRVPTVVLQGDDDDLVPPANADYVERAFTGARVELRRIPGAGHFVLWQQPELVRDAVGDLLDRASSPIPVRAPQGP